MSMASASGQGDTSLPVGVAAGLERDGSALAPPKPSFEQWRPREASPRGRRPSYCRWAVGDWLVSREADHRGYVAEESYDVALAILAAGGVRVTRGDLYITAHVSRAVEPSRRREALSCSHHREVAHFQPDLQDALLDLAEEDGLSCIQLRRVVARR